MTVWVTVPAFTHNFEKINLTATTKTGKISRFTDFKL
jgi:hypothetical protein